MSLVWCQRLVKGNHMRRDDKQAEWNNPRRAGEYASQPVTFGPFNRFQACAVHTRFETVSWFVWDAETPDEDRKPTIVAQEPTLHAAMRAARRAV